MQYEAITRFFKPIRAQLSIESSGAIDKTGWRSIIKTSHVTVFSFPPFVILRLIFSELPFMRQRQLMI